MLDERILEAYPQSVNKETLKRWVNGNYTIIQNKLQECGMCQMRQGNELGEVSCKYPVKKELTFQLLAEFRVIDRHTLDQVIDSLSIENGKIVAYRSQSCGFSGIYNNGQTIINTRITSTVLEEEFKNRFGTFVYKILIPKTTPMIIMKLKQLDDKNKMRTFHELLLPPGEFQIIREADEGRTNGILEYKKSVMFSDRLSDTIHFDYLIPATMSGSRSSGSTFKVSLVDQLLPFEIAVNIEDENNIDEALEEIDKWIKDTSKPSSEDIQDIKTYLNHVIKISSEHKNKAQILLDQLLVEENQNQKQGGNIQQYYEVKYDKSQQRKYVVYKRKKQYLDQHKGQYRFNESRTSVRFLSTFKA